MGRSVDYNVRRMEDALTQTIWPDPRVCRNTCEITDPGNTFQRVLDQYVVLLKQEYCINNQADISSLIAQQGRYS